MGLDQSIFLVKLRKDLKDVYHDADCPEDLRNAEEFQYLRKEYAVQQFMYELGKKKGIKDTGDFYGAFLRVTEEDIKKLYEIADAKTLSQYETKWRNGKKSWDYEDWNVERIKNFCRAILGAIVFGEYAAYYESDW